LAKQGAQMAPQKTFLPSSFQQNITVQKAKAKTTNKSVNTSIEALGGLSQTNKLAI